MFPFGLKQLYVYMSVFTVMLFCGPAVAVSIEGVDRVRLIQELYHNARIQNPNAEGAFVERLTEAEARDLIGQHTSIVNGRSMNIRVPSESEGNLLGTVFYNRANGENKVEQVITIVRPPRNSNQLFQLDINPWFDIPARTSKEKLNSLCSKVFNSFVN